MLAPPDIPENLVKRILIPLLALFAACSPSTPAAPPAPVGPVPVVFNATASARPLDLVSIQGEDFGAVNFSVGSPF